MGDILIPVGLLSAIAILCAIILTVADKFFGIKEDEKFLAIRDALPGANCGACGYSGCDAYAKALAEGKTAATNLCVPGGDKSSQDIAAVLGVEAEDVVEKVAYVACNGNCQATERRYVYDGIKSCRIANLSYSGDKLCAYACLGYGDCVAICPQDAITIEDGVAKVDPTKCIGCGICVDSCPVDGKAIHVDGTAHYDYDKCIKCYCCQEMCPEDAITVKKSLLARIADRKWRV